MNFNIKKRKEGFTLIELIAVLVVLAIIAVIVVPLMLNVVKKSKIAANKRSVDAYGKAVELAIANYMLKERNYPISIRDLEVEYTGKRVDCKVSILYNSEEDGNIYLSGCSVGGVEVLDSKTADGYYHYGKEGLNDRYYVNTYGLLIEKSLAKYVNENNSTPSSLAELAVDYNEKNITCDKFEVISKNTIYLSECSVDGVVVLDNNSTDGYYHYGGNYKEYSVGDMVSYNGINFYVIENSDKKQNYVTLIKDEPLKSTEMTDLINSTEVSDYADLSSTYFKIPYLVKDTCASAGVGDVSGCTTDYNVSTVKQVVDVWSSAMLNDSDLKVDSLGHTARLITYDELNNNLGYDNATLNGQLYDVNKSYTPDFVYNSNYSYWTMSPFPYVESYRRVWGVDRNGGLSGYGIYGNGESYVRPVINLKKSAIIEQ